MALAKALTRADNILARPRLGCPAAAGTSLQSSGCQTKPWATSSSEMPHPPCAACRGWAH